MPGLVEELKGKVTLLRITCSEPGATVRVREKVLGQTPLKATSLNAGPAHVEVRKEGFITYAADLDLVGGGSSTNDVVLRREPPKRPTTVVVAQKDTKTVGYVVGGIGLGIVAVSGVFGYLAYQQGEDSKCPAPCPRGTIIDAQGTTLPNPAYENATQAYDRALTSAHISTAAFAVGLAGVAVGGYFLFRKPTSTSTTAGAFVGPDGAVHF